MKVGDLTSFKPKSFSDDDWSNPGIVLGSFISKGFECDDEVWIVWINGHKCFVNERVDDVVIITGS